jgi:AcrR family transcriptional regulator
MRTAPTRAERQARTRTDLIDAAERLFSANGFHPTSLDAVADAAGYTKGAVYSNFSSKEDLFFAVYERRVERFLEDIGPRMAESEDVAEGVLGVIAEVAQRRGEDDGWLAVFFEFWTHVLRHPEYRERFAAIHSRGADPFVTALERFAQEREIELPLEPRELAVSFFAMGTGLSLEQLTQPDVVDARVAVGVQRLMFELLEGRDGSGLPTHAAR